MVFIELPLFQKYVSFSDEDLRALQNALIENPRAGDVIPGSGGLRKLRIPLPGRGKRGGGRVIYLFPASHERCYLVLAYPKNLMDDLTPGQLATLSTLMKEIIDGNG